MKNENLGEQKYDFLSLFSLRNALLGIILILFLFGIFLFFSQNKKPINTFLSEEKKTPPIVETLEKATSHQDLKQVEKISPKTMEALTSK